MSHAGERDTEPVVRYAPAGVTTAEALHHAATWHHAVAVQRIRLTSNLPMPLTGEYTRQADRWLFVMALSRLRFSVEVVRQAVAEPARPGVVTAGERYDADPAVRDVKALRDLIEHAEDYLFGAGRVQRSAWPAGEAPRLVEWTGSADGHVIHVAGLVPGRVLTVDVDDAAEAGARLFHDLSAAARRS